MKEFEIFIKNLLLKLLLLLNPQKKNNSAEVFNNSSKILFIRLNNIGDALVTTPLIGEIKKQTGCSVYILADRKNHFIFSHNKDVDFVWKFEKGIAGFFRILKKINNENFNAIVDLHDDVSTTVSFLLAMCKTANKFGLEKSNKKIYTKTIPKLNTVNHHVIERNAELGKLLNLQINNKDLNVVYTPKPESFQKVDEYIKEKFKDKKYLLGVNISAGGDARFWGVENYKKLLAFLKQYDVNVLLLTLMRDIKAAYEIAGYDQPVYQTPSFDEFAAMISKLDFLFSPDTSTIHLASAFEVPVFGIYVKYNTQDMIWSPYKSDFDCVVTLKPTLKNMTFEEVRDKLKPFLERKLKENL